MLGVITDQIQHQTALENGVAPERISIFATQAEAAEAVAGGAVHAYASVAMAHRGYLIAAARCAACRSSMFRQPKSSRPSALSRSPRTMRPCASASTACLGDLLGSAWHREMMRSYGFSDADIDRLL